MVLQRSGPRRRRPPHLRRRLRRSKSWADPQIRVVTAAGILGDDPATFRPTDPLTRGELADALGVWGKPAVTPADPSKLVTMSELDAQLVGALGLTPAARRIRIAARDAGLAPTSRLGTETVARLLGLRLNHPLGSDDLELLPSQPATRAEAAYSLARAVSLSAGQVMWLDQLSQSFFVPELSSWQRAVLGRALRFVGYPYVWAGTSEVTQKIWRATAPGSWVTVPGGFDCSGFVWRVYKTKPFPGAPLLGDILKGRTTYAMSGEVKKPARIGIDALEPGDVVFFGAHGATVDPGRGGPHRDLRRQRLVRPLVGRRRDAAAAAGLVFDDVCVGQAPVARGRARGPVEPGRPV